MLIRKNEIDTLLSDPNIRIGFELESICPKFEEENLREGETHYAYHDMIYEYDVYTRAFEEWLDTEDTPPPDLPQYAIDRGCELGDDIPDPADLFSHKYDSLQWAFDNLLKDYFRADLLPFHYKVSYDAYESNKKRWLLKPDPTLGVSGVEISSPILRLDKYLEVCPLIFRHINKYASTDKRCGFHINLSDVSIRNLENKIDVVKMSLLMPEGWVYRFFTGRKYNKHVKSVRNEVYRVATDKKMKPKALKTKLKYDEDHSMAINIEHLSESNKYVEFRYVGGRNYHKKWPRIREATAMFIKLLKVSCDVDAYKKEYLHKKYKMIQGVRENASLC